MTKKSSTAPKHAAKPRKSDTTNAKPGSTQVKSAATGAASDPAIRSGSKQQTCLDLLARRVGVTVNELSAATGWQTHSVRGFLSGTVKKKLGFLLASSMGPDGLRRYRLDGQREAGR